MATRKRMQAMHVLAASKHTSAYVSKQKRMQATSMCSKQALAHATLQHRMQKRRRCIAHELTHIQHAFFFSHPISSTAAPLDTLFFEIKKKKQFLGMAGPRAEGHRDKFGGKHVSPPPPPPQKNRHTTPFPTSTLQLQHFIAPTGEALN